MSDKRNDPKSLLMMVSSLLIFGSIGMFRKFIPLSSGILALSRGILGGVFILAIARLLGLGTRERLSSRQLIWLAVTGAAIGTNWILLFEAFNHTTVAIATLCYYMQPTIVTLLSPAIFKERLTPRKMACAVVAVIGMVLVSGVIGGAGQQGTSMRGVLLGLSAAVLYSAVVIMNKKVDGVDAYQKTTVQLLSAGAVMVPYLLISGGLGSSAIDGGIGATTVILLLVVGIVHTGLAYLLYFGSMDGLRLQSIAIVSYIDPVSALLFSAIFLKEPMSALGIVGAIMIIGSAIISEMQAASPPGEADSQTQTRGGQ